MHEINWKWQNRVGKMFTSVKIKAVAKGPPEHTLSPGWWPHLMYLEADRAAAGLPMSQAVCCQ